MELIERNAVLEVFADMIDSHDCNIIARYYSEVDVDTAMQTFRDIPAVNRWISVEDALPEIGYSVLVTRQTESNTRYIRIASRQDDCWMDNTDRYLEPNPHQVIAWIPMPDAYEPPEKE